MARKSPATTQRTTIQMRSMSECQYWRKSNPRLASSSCSAMRGEIGFAPSGWPTVAELGNGCSFTRRTLIGRYYTERGNPERAGCEFRSKNAFRDGDGVARLNDEVAAAFAGQAFGVDLLEQAGGHQMGLLE